MATSQDGQCDLGLAPGVHDIVIDPNAPYLEDLFSQDSINLPVMQAYADRRTKLKVEKTKKKQNTKNVFILGQNKATTSANEAAEDFMNRDYSEIQNYKGTKVTNPGAIIVPEVHVSDRPIAAYDPKKDPGIVKVTKNINSSKNKR